MRSTISRQRLCRGGRRYSCHDLRALRPPSSKSYGPSPRQHPAALPKSNSVQRSPPSVLSTATISLPKPAQPLTSRSRSTAPSAFPNSHWPRPALSVVSPPGNVSSASTACRSPRPLLPSPGPPRSDTTSPTRSMPNSSAWRHQAANAGRHSPPTLVVVPCLDGFAPPWPSATSIITAEPTAKHPWKPLKAAK